MKLISPLFLILILFFMFSQKGAATNQSRPDSSEKTLIKMIRQIEAAEPFLSMNQINSILGFPLAKGSVSENAYFSFFEGKSGKNLHLLIRKASWRVSKTQAQKRSVLILEVNKEKFCFNAKEVLEEFGKNTTEKEPDYLRYEQSWGSLAFGITFFPKECINTIILNSADGKSNTKSRKRI